MLPAPRQRRYRLYGSGESFLGDLRFGSAFLRDQECRQSARIFVSHAAVRLYGPRTQSLWIFHPLVDPRGGKPRANVGQRGTDVPFVCLGIEDVASLAGILAIEQLAAEFHLSLGVAGRRHGIAIN